MIKYINSLDTGGQLETDYILAKKINEIIHYINDNEIKSKNYITKDKIKIKINQYKTLAEKTEELKVFFHYNNIISVLESLLEED